MSRVYEILIPKSANIGDVKAFNLQHNARGEFTREWHAVFESHIFSISGGLSVYPEIRGVWADNNGEVFAEVMIPYRIICTAQEIDGIVEFARKHYKQQAIFVLNIGTAKIYE